LCVGALDLLVLSCDIVGTALIANGFMSSDFRVARYYEFHSETYQRTWFGRCARRRREYDEAQRSSHDGERGASTRAALGV